MIEFINQVVQQFGQLKAIEQLTVVAGLLSLLGLPVVTWITTLFRLRNARDYASKVEATNASLQIQRDRAEQELKEERGKADLWLPDRWMGLAQLEREQGNEEKAIAALGEGFERSRPGMARTALALAGHHLSLTVGPDATANLIEGERFARLATLLDPADPDAAFLLEDAQMMQADDHLAVSIAPISFLPSNQAEAVAAIDALTHQIDVLLNLGRPQVALRLSRRSTLIAHRAGLGLTAYGLNAGHCYVESLDLCGKYEEALSEIRMLLEKMRTMDFEKEDIGFLIRILEIKILDHVGSYSEALVKIDGLMPSVAMAWGREHPEILSLRHLEAWVIYNNGDLQGSLAKVETLLADQKRSIGHEHRGYIATSHLEVRILEGLHRNEEALERIGPLLKVHERVFGQMHPSTLQCRHLEVRILHSLGRDGEALDKITELVPMREGVIGAAHPNTVASRHFELVILAGLGRNDDVSRKAAALLPLAEAVLGKDHFLTIEIRNFAGMPRAGVEA